MLLGRRLRGNSVQTVAVSLNRMRRLQVRFGLLRELCWFTEMVSDAAISERRNSDVVDRSLTLDKPVFVPAEATENGDLVLSRPNVTVPQNR